MLFKHYAGEPYYNMAFDEWMLEKVIHSESLFILRLYSWSTGTITFGYNQKREKAFDNTKVKDTPLIRRITGGRAIFHDTSELTYSLALSEDLVRKGVVAESITEASAEIAKILVSFLHSLEIESDFMRKSSPLEQDKEFFHSAPCFDSYSKFEILAQQQKIIASAQRRIFGAVLQHGSIKINGLRSHPALSHQVDNVMIDNEISELSSGQFEHTLSHFTKSFENYFQTSFQFFDLQHEDKEIIKKRQKLVEKKSLEKRDIIKQIV